MDNSNSTKEKSRESLTEDNDTDDDRPIELPITKDPTRTKLPHGLATTSNEWHKPRDPRFDPRCAGTNDIRHFVKNYSFIDDLRHKELDELERALKHETNPDKKFKIKQTITRIKNKMVERDNKRKKLDVVGELRLSTSQVGGSKFKNVKKSDIKKALIVEKYKQLKESGKLSKYLERKRKKLINRDGKSFAL